jgi:hypothetical protein
LQSNNLDKSAKTALASCLAFLSQKYPDLSTLIEYWPKLPEAVKQEIRALAKFHGG